MFQAVLAEVLRMFVHIGLAIVIGTIVYQT